MKKMIMESNVALKKLKECHKEIIEILDKGNETVDLTSNPGCRDAVITGTTKTNKNGRTYAKNIFKDMGYKNSDMKGEFSHPDYKKGYNQ